MRRGIDDAWQTEGKAVPSTPQKKDRSATEQKQFEAREKAFRLEVSQRVLLLRLALGMNQSEFARFIGIKKPSYNQQESGLYLPSIQTALSIDERTSCTLDWIYKGTTAGVPGSLLAKMNSVPKGNIK